MTDPIFTAVKIFADQDRFHDYWISNQGNNTQDKLQLIQQRFQALLPPSVVEGKRILDVGSCNGLAGAWCLSHGANHYTGVELQEQLHSNAVQCFDRSYDPSQYHLWNGDINNFLDSDPGEFDLVIFLRVLQITPDWERLLKITSGLAKEIIIENSHPHVFAEMLTENYDQDSCYDQCDRDLLHTLLESRILRDRFRLLIAEKLPIMHYRISHNIYVSNNQDPSSVTIMGNYPSLGLLRNLFATIGWKYHPDIYENLQRALPDLFGFPHGFAAKFTACGSAQPAKFADYFSQGQLKKLG